MNDNSKPYPCPSCQKDVGEVHKDSPFCQWCGINKAEWLERFQLSVQEETIHRTPRKGEGFTPCCLRSPLELPRTDRLTEKDNDVTCEWEIPINPGVETFGSTFVHLIPDERKSDPRDEVLPCCGRTKRDPFLYGDSMSPWHPNITCQNYEYEEARQFDGTVRYINLQLWRSNSA